MMNAAWMEKELYRDFDAKRDSLFFKVGDHGVLCFHGKNYNIRKRMTSEERNSLLNEPAFIPVSSDCYVNLEKISHIEGTEVFFGDHNQDAKRLVVNKRKVYLLRQALSKQGLAAAQ